MKLKGKWRDINWLTSARNPFQAKRFRALYAIYRKCQHNTLAAKSLNYERYWSSSWLYRYPLISFIVGALAPLAVPECSLRLHGIAGTAS